MITGVGLDEEEGVIERWMPVCDVRLLRYSTVDIPEVMELQWVHRFRAGSLSMYVFALRA